MAVAIFTAPFFDLSLDSDPSGSGMMKSLPEPSPFYSTDILSIKERQR